MTTSTRVAPNGMKIIGSSRMLDIALAKANTAFERIENDRQIRRKQNYLRQRAYYERGLAMRAMRGDLEAIAELAQDGLTAQGILNPTRDADTSQDIASEIILAPEVEGESSTDGMLGETFVLGA